MKKLLQDVAAGRTSVRQAERALEERFSRLPVGNDVCLDLGREHRTGFPEAVFGAGKSVEQVVKAFFGLVDHQGKALATRCSAEALTALRQKNRRVKTHPASGVAWYVKQPVKSRHLVAVAAAGTSDLRVAEEAALTLEFAGIGVERVYDVGVAGIHRLLGKLPVFHRADAAIVVAGMEGALPSVLGGLTDIPLIAVPTSVGYGAGLQGLSALLTMLNSCAPGLAVVNIDNGFGAAVAVIRILKGTHT
ncbi:MAG TPA: nickel pincer cofactor biosynthesis protein LarB [Candidatus Ozemobacteraceae bacterium]|nr:nickel pincer cofactor biosynthesis protein LarB [Candidatus Ozemobacteraceae bacterium]